MVFNNNYITIIGDEIEKGIVKIRNVVSKAEEVVSRSELVNELKKRL